MSKNLFLVPAVIAPVVRLAVGGLRPLAVGSSEASARLVALLHASARAAAPRGVLAGLLGDCFVGSPGFFAELDVEAVQPLLLLVLRHDVQDLWDLAVAYVSLASGCLAFRVLR